MATATEAKAPESNLDVDYVIRYSFEDVGEWRCLVLRHTGRRGMLRDLVADRSQTVEQLEKLLRTLATVGLQTEVRQGDELSLLVFVRASKKRLNRAIYRSR